MGLGNTGPAPGTRVVLPLEGHWEPLPLTHRRIGSGILRAVMIIRLRVCLNNMEDIAGALYRARMARILGVGGSREAHMPGWGHALYCSMTQFPCLLSWQGADKRRPCARRAAAERRHPQHTQPGGSNSTSLCRYRAAVSVKAAPTYTREITEGVSKQQRERWREQLQRNACALNVANRQSAPAQKA